MAAVSNALLIPVPRILRVKCHYCQKDRSDFETIRINKVRMCWVCYDWHLKALKAFSGEPPAGCQGCGRTYDELEAMSRGGDVQFTLVPKDGIYQILCRSFCDRPYLEKRTELFKGTPFGSKVLKV